MSSITPVLLVHGGAGRPRGGVVDDEPAHHAALAEALRAGWDLLGAGGPALDAAEAAVRSLEDCALFNAGRGSVLTRAGRVEMDAAVMDAATGRAGACASVTGVRHPVTLARSVMETTPHVLLAGAGAEQHARSSGLELEDPEWFVTAAERGRTATAAAAGAPDAQAGAASGPGGEHGTVGAVALDSAGRLAAATSTGGLRGQLPGRVGDSPLIGAGTWADSDVAVSCTGTGECFIRTAAAHELSALLRHGGNRLAAAACRVIDGLGGDGGLIALGRDGSWAMPFNTPLMHRGRASARLVRTWIWNEEENGA